MTANDINQFNSSLDPSHRDMGFNHLEFSREIWKDKYCWRDEEDIFATAWRVAKGICINDTEEFQKQAYDAIAAGLWIPAGRILAGAGTPKAVTLMNCYVNQKIEDSMPSIMQANSIAALTMQQGGGIGTDFSTIRPAGALLERTGTKASGPLPFMHMWNSMCATIRSAGDRRGAMMATLSDTHPDVIKFITAKHEKGVLTNFNVSVLVSDALMEAVREDADWMLYFPKVSLDRDPGLAEYDFIDDETGEKQFVYQVLKARDLWEMIIRNSYEWSEPGVIFIDRVNELNNLWYCEDIRCTNPCGEQPLPPHGTCNLGSLFLSRMVKNPFTEDAAFDFELLRKITRIGVRFLDNVIDVTQYPLPEQKQEEVNKRRLGLGFTGLADVFAQMGMPYGSYKSGELAEQIMREICFTSYDESVKLAQERGAFPLFDAEQFLAPNTFASKRLPSELKEKIRKYGIRNGLILTVAPTGTISTVFGNPSSGLEPIFAKFQDRNVLQPDNSWKKYENVPNYAVAIHRYMFGEGIELPTFINDINDLSVEDHLFIQAKIQQYTDASVSKTTNCPEDITYDAFVKVYENAYNMGCKGCTTYRPSEVRGSILMASGSKKEKPINVDAVLTELPTVRNMKRAAVLEGKTYQIKWPTHKAALYLIINHDDDGEPYEVFITSKDGSQGEWTTALTLMITAIFKKGGDIGFVAEELKQIQSLRDGCWINKRYYGSLPAYIGYLIEQHLNPTEETPEEKPELEKVLKVGSKGTVCNACNAPAIVKESGCEKCMNCGWTKCD